MDGSKCERQALIFRKQWFSPSMWASVSSSNYPFIQVRTKSENWQNYGCLNGWNGTSPVPRFAPPLALGGSLQIVTLVRKDLTVLHLGWSANARSPLLRLELFGKKNYMEAKKNLYIMNGWLCQLLSTIELCFFSLLNCKTQIGTPTRGLRKPLLPCESAYARVTFQEVPTRLPPQKLLQRSLYLTWCGHNSGSEEE